jgi:hypothetical protein
MVTTLHWRRSYHIVPSRFPAVGIFDAVADADDLDAIVELEAATNPRVLDELGRLSLVRPEERISGPGTTPVMAAFTHAQPSRFSDGSFGAYYAAHDIDTAIAETAFHRGRFLREAHLPNERLDMRVYTAAMRGAFDDLRERSMRSPLYNKGSYDASQIYARALHEARRADGVVFRSVRREGGICAAAFRPRCVTQCTVAGHLEYRFESYELVGAYALAAPSGSS